MPKKTMSQSLIDEAVCTKLSNLLFEFCRRLGASLCTVRGITEEDLSDLVAVYRGLTGEPTYQLPNPIEAWRQHFRTVLKLARLTHPSVRECVESFNKHMVSLRDNRDEKCVNAIFDCIQDVISQIEQVPKDLNDILVVMMPRITKLLSLSAKTGHHLAKQNSTNPRFREVLPDIHSHLSIILTKAGKELKFKDVHKELTYWAAATSQLLTFMEGKSMTVVDIHGVTSIVKRSQLEREMGVMLSLEMDMRYHNHLLGSSSKILLIPYDSVPVDWYSALSSHPRAASRIGHNMEAPGMETARQAARQVESQMDAEELEEQLRQANLGVGSEGPQPAPVSRPRITWRPPQEVEEASLVFEDRAASSGEAPVPASSSEALPDNAVPEDESSVPEYEPSAPEEDCFGFLDELVDNIRTVTFAFMLEKYHESNKEYKRRREIAKKHRNAFLEARALSRLSDLGQSKIKALLIESIHIANRNYHSLKNFKNAMKRERAQRRLVPRPTGQVRFRVGGDLWGVETIRPGGPVDVMWFDRNGVQVFWNSAARDFPLREGEPVVVPMEENTLDEDEEGNWGVYFRDANGQRITKWYNPDGSPLV